MRAFRAQMRTIVAWLEGKPAHPFFTWQLRQRGKRHLRRFCLTGGNMQRYRLPGLTIIVMAAILLLGGPVSGQLRIVGRISGTVQDPSGALVPNARVVLKDTKTGITREATASEGGTFLFPDLASGLYEVTVSSPGFRTSLVPNISVSTSQT